VSRSLQALHGGRKALPTKNDQVDDVAYETEDADADDDYSVQCLLDAFLRAGSWIVAAVNRPCR